MESGALRGAAGVGSRRCSPRGGTRDRGVGRPEARMITGTAVGRGSRPASASRRLAGLSVGCWKRKGSVADEEVGSPSIPSCVWWWCWDSGIGCPELLDTKLNMYCNMME
ncbi:hypothetical protein M6B38_236925 [Iris pallida]|uniref:Uncharacterized protein n=1 Tax=Iris pallida TaxID=29817 RepID=A0AAX6DLT3_IRIPA|nr:hypothetical protein M6B38_236925 [Iris pallida]